MVGTAMNSVRPPRCMRSQTASALKAGSMSQTAPDQRAQPRTLTMPWMWWRGRTWRMRSSAVQPQASTREVIWAWMVAWAETTPLGRLVVPLV